MEETDALEETGAVDVIELSWGGQKLVAGWSVWLMWDEVKRMMFSIVPVGGTRCY
jgi:hypothetical protein